MVLDIQYTKVPVFPDVNNTPIAPTASKAGNGSHIIDQYNKLVDEVETNINDLIADISVLYTKVENVWTTTTGVEHYAQPGEKVIFLNYLVSGSTIYKLYLPNTPTIGSTVTFMATSGGSDELEIRNFGQFNYNGNLARLYVIDAYIERTLIYIGFPYGWISTSNANYLTTNQE